MRQLSLCLCLALLAARAASAGTPAEPLTFEQHIRPLLKAHCFHCHGEGETLEGGLDLRLRRLIVSGGDSGGAVVPGAVEESYLLDRVLSGEMPPGDVEKLSPEHVELLRRWIDQDAPTARPEPDSLGDGLLITPEDRAYWAFQPIADPALPAVAQPERVRTPVDRFVLARLEAEGMEFTPDASRITLIRRLTLDLTGLPPTPEEVERFEQDPSLDAYEALVERLLASPQYGERWGRHWLDVAGYADSDGYTPTDAIRPWSWKYRDYVIRAFNDDKPFDQFLVEQLAGDELVAPPYKDLKPEEIEKLVATGFLRMAPDGTGSGPDDPLLARHDVVAETVKIVSTSLLGLTIGCAQCHHHRYDPISHEDYYSFRAVFDPALDASGWRTPQQRLISVYSDADRQRSAAIEAEAKQLDATRLEKQAEFIRRTYESELAKLPDALREPVRAAHGTDKKQRTDEQKALLKQYPSVNVTAGSLYLYDRKAADELQALADSAKALRAQKPVEEFIAALTEVPGKVPASHVFARGDHEQPKAPVVPALLSVIDEELTAPLPVDDLQLPTTGRRLALARWITGPDNPLTARVIANRVWMHHFGRGIVATPGDFGYLGSRPTHPELLDWLALELTGRHASGASGDQGWSLKRLHRAIVHSTAYRQSLRTDPRWDQVDPDNALYGGSTPRRLDAEAFRDSVLAVSGSLNDKRHGPPVPVMADAVGQWVIGIENLNAGRPGAVIAMNGEDRRRSVYVQARRSRPLGVLETFDWPTMAPNCEARSSSTVTPQALLLMNSEFLVTRSQEFAARVAREAGAEPAAQLRHAWQLAYARSPADTELAAAVGFLNEQTAHFQALAAEAAAAKPPLPEPGQRALATLCQVLLSSNEFLYVD